MSMLTRRGPRGLLLDLFELLEPPFVLPWQFGGQAMRIEEGIQNGRYVVRAEMPGIDPQRQAEVTADNGILIVQAERSEGDDSTGHSEFRYGSFCRRVTLPPSADEADIQASYDNGIIEISIGLKAEQAADHDPFSVPIRLVQHIKPT
jgi:HSP20 family protein